MPNTHVLVQLSKNSNQSVNYLSALQHHAVDADSDLAGILTVLSAGVKHCKHYM